MDLLQSGTHRLMLPSRKGLLVPNETAIPLTRTVKDISHIYVDGPDPWNLPPITTVADSLLVVCLSTMSVGSSGTSPETMYSITDTQGLTWNLECSAGDANSWSIGCAIWTAIVDTGDTTTITFNDGIDSVFYSLTTVLQYTGCNLVSPVGGVGSGSSGGSLPRTMEVNGYSYVELSSAPAVTSEIVSVATLDPSGSVSVSLSSGYEEIELFDAGGHAYHTQVRLPGSSSDVVSWDDIAGSSSHYKTCACALEIKAA